MFACAFAPMSDCGSPHRRAPLHLTIRVLTLAVGTLWLVSGAAWGQPGDLAVLQGLDKVTGRISAIEAPVGRTVRFGTLEITARICHTRPPEETPETTVFLDVFDIKPGEPPARLFSGWMFASSPALNALEHPVYDIWVIDCKIISPDQS